MIVDEPIFPEPTGRLRTARARQSGSVVAIPELDVEWESHTLVSIRYGSFEHHATSCRDVAVPQQRNRRQDGVGERLTRLQGQRPPAGLPGLIVSMQPELHGG